MDALVDAARLSKLKWRCRRGMLENDLLIERFFATHEDTLTERQARAMTVLMDLADNDLLDVLLARTEPTGKCAEPDVIALIDLMRAPSGRSVD